MRAPYFAIAVWIALLNYVQSAKILGLFPHTGKSHHMVFEPLLLKLAERGHHVTSVSFFPLKTPPANYTDVSLEGIQALGVESVDLSMFENSNKVLRQLGVERFVQQLFAFWPLDEYAINVCRKLVDWPALQEALKQDYDVVIVEYFNSDCMLGLMHVYGVKAPIVGVSSCGFMPWVPERLGVPENPSYVPVMSTGFSTRMTFLQRLENTFLNVWFKYWFRQNVLVKEKEIIEKHFGRKIPELDEVGKNLSVILLNTFPTLNEVRPLLPSVVEVGGMHMDHTKKPIPQYMERFVNESEYGVVLVSFGSLIRTSTIPPYKEEMIMSALSKLKQRVIWKYENSGEEGTLTGNILKVRWIPQFQLLKHPKVIAFVAHGGLLGMTEAVSAGKPMVVVPFFGDQPNNAAAAEVAGLGAGISYAELTEASLSKALEKVLSAEMRLNARQVSQIWKDRPMEPLDTAVYWTERVIRWGAQSPLHSAARDLTFVQYALIDVAAAFLLAVIVLILALRFVMSLISRLLGIGNKKVKVH